MRSANSKRPWFTVFPQPAAVSILLFAASNAYAEKIHMSLPFGGRMTMWMEYAVPFLKPCSRRGPEEVASFWTPTESQLDELEAKLIVFLKSREADESGYSTPPSTSYHRQYLGFIKNGRRYIYGNFYSGWGKMTQAARDKPVRVCDGGPAFWGIVFDPESGEFSDLVVNPVV